MFKCCFGLCPKSNDDNELPAFQNSLKPKRYQKLTGNPGHARTTTVQRAAGFRYGKRPVEEIAATKDDETTTLIQPKQLF